MYLIELLVAILFFLGSHNVRNVCILINKLTIISYIFKIVL